MAFKHIRSMISSASTDQTLYTVPAGKEFVLLRTRARYEGGSSGDDSGDITASNGTQDFVEINGALSEAGTTTVNEVTAPYYSKTVGNNTYYVTRVYSGYLSAVAWIITTYDISDEATGWIANVDSESMAYVTSNASSPVGLTFTTGNATGTPPTFGSEGGSSGAPPAQISYKGYDMFSDMSGTASLTTNITIADKTYDYCYALSNGYYIVYPGQSASSGQWELLGWASNGSSTTPVGRYTAPNGSYIDVTDAGGSGGGYVSDGTFHYGQTPSFFISSSALPSPESTYYAGVFEYDAQSGKYLGRRGASVGAYLNYSNGYFYFGYNGSATRECYTTEANFFGTNTFNGAGSGGIGGKTITIQEDIPFNFNYDDNPSFTVTESTDSRLVGTYSFSLGTAYRYFKDDDNTISLWWDGSVSRLAFMNGNTPIYTQQFLSGGEATMQSNVYGTHSWDGSGGATTTIVRGVTSSGGGSVGPAVSFKIDSNDAFETINVGSNIVVKGQTWKSLYEAGTLIKANATVADMMAEIMGLELKAGTWELVGNNNGGGSGNSVTITYTADTQRSVVLDATEYTSYGETVYRGDSGQTYQGNTIYIWLYKGNVSGTQYWGATMSPTMPTLNGNDVYSNWYAYSTTLINSDYTEVTGMGWSDVSVSQTSGGSSSSAWGGSNTLVASNFAPIAVPGGFITYPNGTYTYNASTDRYEYADSEDDVLFYINNVNEELNLNNIPTPIYYQLWYRAPKTGTVESEGRAYGQTSQTLTSEGSWYDIQGTMSLDPDAVVVNGGEGSGGGWQF